MEEFNNNNIETILEFIDGEVNDIYLFVKKYCYKDMWKMIYAYSYNKLRDIDNLEDFIKETLVIYKRQNKLNKALKITDGKYFDDFLMKCVCSNLHTKFGTYKALENETMESFYNKVVEAEKRDLNNELISEYNINYLTSLMRNKFEDADNFSIEEVIDFIKQLSTDDHTKKEIEEDFFSHLNNLIENRKFSLNQFGRESLIKKDIYEISLGKIPTKNQLIMIAFTLKLNKEESNNLFYLAKELVKTNRNSNMYCFDSDNKRDALIVHWLNNINQLQKMAKKKGVKIVEIVNSILKDSNYDILS